LGRLPFGRSFFRQMDLNKWRLHFSSKRKIHTNGCHFYWWVRLRSQALWSHTFKQKNIHLICCKEKYLKVFTLFFKTIVSLFLSVNLEILFSIWLVSKNDRFFIIKAR
jgi:hypothetical protein